MRVKIYAGKGENFIVLSKIDEMKYLAKGNRSGRVSGMSKKVFITSMLGVLLFACSGLGIEDYNEVFKEKGHPPIILGYYAPEAIRPGTTWKIYLRAEDKDGNMAYVTATLYQADFGYYATDYTRLEGKDKKECLGYIALKTPSDTKLTLDKFTMEIVFVDSQNYKSKAVQLPLTFAYLTQTEIPAAWQAAANHPLGELVTRIQSTASLAESSGS